MGTSNTVSPAPACRAKAPGADCKNCPLKDQPHARPKPRAGGLLTLLGEGPGRNEVEQNQYFVGATGRLIEEDILPPTGLKMSDLNKVNATLCLPLETTTDEDLRKAVDCCRPRMLRDLKTAGNKVILSAGKWALYALTEQRSRIMDKMGAPIVLGDYTVLPTLHPAFLFRGEAINYKPVIQKHFERAGWLAKGELQPWVWPELVVDIGPDAERTLKRLRDYGRAGHSISCDVETIGDDPFTSPMSCIGFGHRDIGAVSIPWETYDTKKFGRVDGVSSAKRGLVGRLRSLILEILADPKIEKVGQNFQYDLMTLYTAGIEVRGKIFDTRIGHHTYAEGLKHNLDLICAIEFHAPRWKVDFHGGEKGKQGFERQDPREVRLYNCKDNIMQSHLEKRCRDEMAKRHNGLALFAHKTEVQTIANEMTWRGVGVDEEKRAVHSAALRRRIRRRKIILRKFAAKLKVENFNPDSNRSLRQLFFDRLRVQPTRKSEKTGAPSLDEATLASLLGSTNEIIATCARAILGYRRWKTLYKNHVKGLRIGPDGNCHPMSNPVGAITGRWSSSRPNINNVPKPVEKRLKDGTRKVIYPGIRDIFVSPVKGNWVVEADYKQIELRILAWLANDTPLLTAFAAYDAGTGPSPHVINARALFGVPKDRQPTTKEKTLAKNFVYNVNYGGDANSIHAILNADNPIELRFVQKMVERWFVLHPRIREWQNAVAAVALKRKYVEEPISGRRRYFWGDVKETEVYNFPIQACAARVIDEAILRVRKRLKWGKEGIMFQNHDALIVDGPNPYRLAGILNDEMTTTLTMNGRSIVLPVDIKVGRSVGDAEEMTMEQIKTLSGESR